jgi:hypothetical protein
MYFNNGRSDPHKLDTCSLPVDMVGRSIQPFEGTRRDRDGTLVKMWNVGDTLVLLVGQEVHKPSRQEHFIIESVTKTRQ